MDGIASEYEGVNVVAKLSWKTKETTWLASTPERVPRHVS